MTETPSDPVDREPQSAPAPPVEDPPEDGAAPEPTGRGGGVLRWVALILLLGLAGVQGAGVLLRDHLEGRKKLGGLRPAPVASPSVAPQQPPQAPASPPRFGPDVREVAVAQPPEAPLPATAPAPSAPASPAVPPATAPSSEPAVSPSPAPKPPIAARAAPPVASSPAPSAPAPNPQPPAPAPSPQPPAPASPAPAASPKPPQGGELASAGGETARAEGTHVLQMGVFRSQKYRRELEEQLAALSVPHYRTEGTRSGAGYRLTVPTPDAEASERAARVLDDGGYAYRTGTEGIEVRFFLEEEAQAAMDLLAKAGFRVGYMRVEGDTPVWTVFAGPYDLDKAQAERERLSKAGLGCYLRRRP